MIATAIILVLLGLLVFSMFFERHKYGCNKGETVGATMLVVGILLGIAGLIKFAWTYLP